jgi:hypothetical protein
MAKVDFGATRKEAEDSGLLGGGAFFKFKEGDNRIRLMSECLPHTSVFDGKKNFKWLCYILDRVDGEVKPFFMPHKIYKAIEALQINPDYQFDEVPMPYDVTVNAKGARTKEVEYALIPARRETALTDDELDKLEAVKPLRELKQALDSKQEKGGVHPPAPVAPATSELTDDDIPFNR